MKNYKITFGSGLAWPYVETVRVEDFEYEQDALDKMIDTLEANGNADFFLTQEQIESGEFYEDEYVIGGNHGLYLHHHGVFKIELCEEGQK